MSPIARLGRPLALSLILPLLAAGALAGEPAALDGRWVLVEQLYEGGGAGLAPSDPPLRLEVSRSVLGLEINFLRGERRFPWPSLVADEGPVPITVLERSEDPGGTWVRVRWSARRGGEDADLVEVEQALAAASADRLEETIRITLLFEGEARGGYTLTRRYEREGQGS
jgi:hypothetical protein